MPLRGRAIDLPRPFGPYTLLRRLAVGGMAEVYVAKTKGIGGFEKLVAIKLIHPRFSEDDHFVQMLVEEAKLSVLLNHVNIGQTFDLGYLDAGTYFIVMEYIEGADAYKMLQKLAKKRAEIPFDICAYLISEVCHGLDYAHRKRDMTGSPLNIVHRDISPQNVLISFAGEVKIVDFGIAKAAMRSGQTEVGVIKGKYYYMSPEQAWADPVDHRSDIFSTGIVLYELLTGDMLYQEDNLPKLLDRVRKAEITPPSRRRPEIPPELDAIVMKALAKHPAERYQSAHDFGQALTQFLYKTMPSFTAARLATLMAQLFPKELELAAGALRPPSGEKKVLSSISDQRVVTESTGSLEVMKPDEFRPDVKKSVIFDLQEFEDERTRDEKKRKMPSLVSTEETDEDMTIVQVRKSDWEDEETTQAARSRLPRPPMKKKAPIDFAEDTWGDATMVDDKGDVLRRMREALEREVAARNKAKQGAPLPPVPKAKTKARRKVPKPSVPPPVASAALRIPKPPPPPAVPGPPSTSGSFEEAITTPEQGPQPAFPTAGRGSASPHLPDLSRGAWDDVSDEERPALSQMPSTAPPARSSETPLETFRFDAVARAQRPRWKVWAIASAVVIAVLLGAMLLRRALADDAPEPRLDVVSRPAGAQVSLDGEALEGATPIAGYGPLELGHAYTLRVVAAGYEPWETSFEPVAGTLQQVAVLSPASRALTIVAAPGNAQLWVDGVLHGRTPVSVNVTMGQQLELRAVFDGGREVRETKVVDDSLGDTVELRAP